MADDFNVIKTEEGAMARTIHISDFPVGVGYN